MPRSIVGKSYVVVDNHDCFVAYNDWVDLRGYAYVTSTIAFPSKSHRYNTRKDAQEHLTYLNNLLAVELSNKIEELKNHPSVASPQAVIDELQTRTFRIATLTVE